MTAKLLSLLALPLCCLGPLAATAQSTAGAAPNLDPVRVRAIVEGEARKAGTRAVLFAAAFDILREVVKYVTPGSPIDF
jgi:hypothetical protein